MEKNITEARRLYLEQYGGTLVTNSYLKAALAVESVALLGALLLCFQTFHWAKNQKPLVVRVDSVIGQPVLDSPVGVYKPAPAELRYFLSQFVQLHYSRMLASIEQYFAKSLFFMDQKLSAAIMDEERRSHSLAAFIRDGGDEIDIEIKNVALQDITSSPMKATVDFEKVFFARGERRELRRERYSGYFHFVVQDNIPNSQVMINPLGLTVTYFRADAAFK